MQQYFAERYETGKVWSISSGRPGGIHFTLNCGYILRSVYLSLRLTRQ